KKVKEYRDVRRHLGAYSHRQNGPAPDTLADEPQNRISKTLEKSGAIATKPPLRYCYVVARFVLLEDLRRERRHVHFDDVRHANVVTWPSSADGDDRAAFVMVRRLACLTRGIRKLKPRRQDSIDAYYV